MREAWHLAKPPVPRDVLRGADEGETACGLSSWNIRLHWEDVTCLRCRGTELFWALEHGGRRR